MNSSPKTNFIIGHQSYPNFLKTCQKRANFDVQLWNWFLVMNSYSTLQVCMKFTYMLHCHWLGFSSFILNFGQCVLIFIKSSKKEKWVSECRFNSKIFVSLWETECKINFEILRAKMLSVVFHKKSVFFLCQFFFWQFPINSFD